MTPVATGVANTDMTSLFVSFCVRYTSGSQLLPKDWVLSMLQQVRTAFFVEIVGVQIVFVLYRIADYPELILGESVGLC